VNNSLSSFVALQKKKFNYCQRTIIIIISEVERRILDFIGIRANLGDIDMK